MMYIYIKTMFEQWAHGQSPYNVVNRIDVFIKMASKSLGFSEAEIRNYLESQEWYPKTLDNK